jgi:glucose/arabinose dehydrogenase/PKD repeat protein
VRHNETGIDRGAKRTPKGRGPVGLVALAATALVAAMLVTLPTQPPAGAASLPGGFTTTTVFSGLKSPTAVAFSPDGKVYVAEKSGIIKVFPSAGSNLGVVFTDLSTRVFDFWDRGLLGLTVDPRLGKGTGHDFIYALYAKDAPPGQQAPFWKDNCPDPPGGLTDGCVVGGALSRIPVKPDGTAGAEQILIENQWCQQFTTHSIGHLQFGADGYLYVTAGDGAGYANADWGQFGGSLTGTPTPVNPCGDPPGGVGVANTSPTARGGALRSQSPRRPLGEPRLLSGALLRVNPDTGAGVPGNPLYSSAAPSSNASRILAYGMRNPFRFTMRPGTNETWVADVGWGLWEEINRVTTNTPTKAPNFGWPCLERTTRLSSYRDLDLCKELYADTVDPGTPPFYAYEHGELLAANDTCDTADNGAAITGLAFYTGSRYPAAYSNALFMADASRNCIWVMEKGADGLPNPDSLRTFIDDSDNPYPVQLTVDPISKDIFYVNIAFGTVNRISYTSSNRAPSASATASPASGNAPLTVTLDGSASSDPDGDTLLYSWDIDGNGTFGDATGKTPTVTYSSAGNYEARLLVTDPGGLTSYSKVVTITVASAGTPVVAAPPVVTGTPQVGGTLTASDGTWTSATAVSLSRQWQRCSAPTGATYKDAVLADSPLAYWRLGETSGTTVGDSSGNSRSGSYAGGVSLAQPGALAGDADTSAYFNGGAAHVVRSGLSGMPATSFSTDLWLRTADTTKDGGIVSYAVDGSSDEFHLRDAKALRVYVKGSRVDTNIAFNDGAWHHLAVTWNSVGGVVKVYKDGELAHTSTLIRAGASLTPGGTMVLGQDQDELGGGFETSQAYLGFLDEVSFYPTELNQTAVQAHRNAGLADGSSWICSEIPGATAPTYVPQVSDEGSRIRVRVTATNPNGPNTAVSAQVGPVTASSGNTPPVPVIATPSTTLKWKAGDVVSFSGSANDAQDGPLAASRLSWDISLGHCTASGCHVHPVTTRDGVSSGTIAAPDHEAPSYIDIGLTATDTSGATARVVRRVEPQSVKLTFRTNPTGLRLTVGSSQETATPFTQNWVVNSRVQMSAPTSQTSSGTSYLLTGWSDKGAATHVVNAPTSDTTYTANYVTPSPFGEYSSATSPSSGNVRVRGWAIDWNSPTTSLNAYVVVGGRKGTAGAETFTIPAGRLREDVALAYPAAGPYHGIDSTVSTSKRGTQTVCLYAKNVGAGSDTELGCRTVDIVK